MEYTEESRRAFVAKKDRQRWCKGKVGRLHHYQPASPEYMTRKYPWANKPHQRVTLTVSLCEFCGKEQIDWNM